MTVFRILLLAVILTCSGTTLPTAFAGMVEGVVLSSRGPVADAVVTAYPDFASLRQQVKGIVSTQGEKPGQYRLSLPPGKFYLVARGKDDRVTVFAYHGLNPLQIDNEYRWIPLIAMPENTIQCQPDAEGFQGVGGRILYKGSPVAGSSVSVYALNDEPFRGMGVLTNTVPEDGSFWFDLDPGTYVLVARKRSGGGAIGPIQKGDLLCYYSGNPIQVNPNQSCVVDISCYPRDDIDAFLADDADDPRGRKEEKRRAASLQEMNMTDSTRMQTSHISQPAFISGRVTDLSGLPLENLYITAYPAGKVPLFQMFVLRMETNYMTRTDRNGFFRLEMESGQYYLVARERIGDAPVAGEYYGIFEGNPNHDIRLQPGEIRSGVHIIAESIMP